MDRLLIAAAHRSSGKTTVSVGLLAALASRGVAVAPFKKGPDYIDPMWLGQAAGRPCHNLDPYLMTPAGIRRCFADGAIAHYVPAWPEWLLGIGGLSAAFLLTVIGVRVLDFMPQDDLVATH